MATDGGLLMDEVDATGLHHFRMAFGTLLALMPVRFAYNGWIEDYYLTPTFHFFWFDGLIVPSSTVLYALYAAMAVCGVAIATGRVHRPAVALYATIFLYIEGLEKTVYLNHYVLVSLLLLVLLFAPYHPRFQRAPRWVLWLLRYVFASVWFWAGVCKVNADWLIRAEPLHAWLQTRHDLPIVGPLLTSWWTAFGMSWGGMLFDVFIAPLLLFRPTRAAGLVLLIGFHAATGALFSIGVFPWVMLTSALLFIDESRQASWRGRPTVPAVRGRISRPHAVVAACVVGVMALSPLRHLATPGWVNWNEHGFRFSWRVLLIEKTGFVEYRLRDPTTGRSWTVNPRTELTELQFVQMRTQPDMILDYARHLGRRFQSEHPAVEVYAESWASLNGRPRQRLVRPDVNLLSVDPWSSSWIQPLD